MLLTKLARCRTCNYIRIMPGLTKEHVQFQCASTKAPVNIIDEISYNNLNFLTKLKMDSFCCVYHDWFEVDDYVESGA